MASKGSGFGRRSFLSGVAASLAAWRRRAIAGEPPKKPQPGAPAPEDFKLPAGGHMPTRALGRTGVEVSLLGLGGYHIGLAKDEATAVRIVRTAIDHGVNFLDNCWDYNDGAQRGPDGPALRDGYRKRAFLMTKIDGRTQAGGRRADRQSPARLRTDRIDLMQIHEVIRLDGSRARVRPRAARWRRWWRRARRARSASSASPATRARRSTCRCWRSRATHGFTFDTVQMPINVMDAHYRQLRAARCCPSW